MKRKKAAINIVKVIKKVCCYRRVKKCVVSAGLKMEQDSLFNFLLNYNLMHLLQLLTDQCADLDFLLHANDHELSLLIPKVVDKGKLRMALDRFKGCKRQACEETNVVTPIRECSFIYTPSSPTSLPDCLTTTPKIKSPVTSTATICTTSPTIAQSITSSTAPISFLSPERLSTVVRGSPSTVTLTAHCPTTLPLTDEAEWDLTNYEEVISSIEFAKVLNDGSLKFILESTTAGKPILKKQSLSTNDRKVITAIIVEAEVRKLKKITDPIRKEVWDNWTTEITTLFPGETKPVYYSPFKIVDGRAIQASGLIVNRLITVRRKLSTKENRRSRSCSSDGSSDSGKKRRRTSETLGRVRPLPDSFHLKDISNQEFLEEDCLQWLRASSSPRDLVDTKWRQSLHERLTLLQEGEYVNYFNIFPALQCPWGYELLADDFHVIYPEVQGKFEEKFPLVKSRLLTLLDEKAQELTREDKSIQSVLDLATLGEEPANVATFLSIPLLLKQMHTISVKGVKKPWNPSRSEVSNAFISLVPNVSDLETYRSEREAKLTQKKVPVLPFIVAVGSNWSEVAQYDVIISKEIRYTFANICEAVTNLFKILWALDLPYPKDCLPIWMFIQRSIYLMKSKFDIEGTPVLDLLSSVTNRHDGAIRNST